MKIVKIKNKADHYNHINFKGKYMYDFEAGEIKEVNFEIINNIDPEKFEIIKEEQEEKTPKKSALEKILKKK